MESNPYFVIEATTLTQDKLQPIRQAAHEEGLIVAEYFVKGFKEESDIDNQPFRLRTTKKGVGDRLQHLLEQNHRIPAALFHPSVYPEESGSSPFDEESEIPFNLAISIESGISVEKKTDSRPDDEIPVYDPQEKPTIIVDLDNLTDDAGELTAKEILDSNDYVFRDRAVILIVDPQNPQRRIAVLSQGVLFDKKYVQASYESGFTKTVAECMAEDPGYIKDHPNFDTHDPQNAITEGKLSREQQLLLAIKEGLREYKKLYLQPIEQKSE